MSRNSHNTGPGWRSRGRGANKSSKPIPKNRINLGKQLVSVSEENEDVKTGIREILLRLEPLVKVSGGNAPLESMMVYLEEIDDSHFEKYTMVRHIKSRLKTSLLELVQAEVQLQCRDTQLTPEKMKMVAPAILSKLMTSSEMDDCLDTLHTEMGEAVSDMCANFDRELVLLSQLRDSPNDLSGSRNSSGLSDSLSSTWNQGGFVFIQPNQYAKLADKLNPYRSAEDRIEALNTLVASQIGECIGSPSWHAIREGLQAALMDSGNTGISNITLKLYSKMLSNVSPYCTKEAFASLTATIINLYKDKSRNYQLPSMATEVSFKKRPTHNLLQICRLIIQTCKDLPRFWNRYPPTHIKEIMKAMLEMVTLKSRGGQKILSPIHLISLVDPKAKWLKAWLHGNIGRQMFFLLVEQFHENLLIKSAVHHLLVALEKDNFPLLSRSSGRKKGLLTSSLVSFAFLSHNLNVTTLVLQYRQGQNMFPLILPNREEPLDGYFVMKTLVHFVANSHQISHLTIAKMICNALIEHLGNSEYNIKKFWINEKIVDIILTPLINWSQQQQQNYMAINLCRLTEIILSSETGIAFAQDVKIESNGLSMPEFFLVFTTQFLKSLMNLNNQTEKLMLISIKICKKIVLSHACVLVPSFTTFVKSVGNALFDLEDLSTKTPTNSMVNISVESHSVEIRDELIGLLKNISSTPKGLYSMAYVDGLLPILFEDLQNFESIILTVFTSNGKFALEENAFLEKTGQEVYKTILEYDVTFWSSNVVKEEHFSSLLSNLVTALSDLEFLNNHLDRLQDTILPFQDINSSFLQVENVFSFRLLSCLVSDLDVQLFIQTKIDLKNMINEYMDNCKNEDQTIVIMDETYLILQKIDCLISEIGGPLERKDQPLSRQVSEDELEISKKTNDLTKLLNRDESKPKNWKNNVKMLYKECASHISLEVISNLINDLMMQDADVKLADFPSNQKTIREITDMESRAIELFQSYVNKYGYSKVSSQNLSQILKLFKTSAHQPIPWTTLVIGAICNGNLAKTHHLSILFQFDQEELVSRIGHQVEMIIIEEMPMLIPCLNFSISLIVRQWIKQCFLNTLDWVDIIHFILIQLLFGKDYIIYCCVSIFYHLQEKIAQENPNELIELLRCKPIEDFHFYDYFSKMEELEKQYQHLISKS